jgi:hypothetical protein
MKTSNALFACLPASEIQTMIDAGVLSRGDVATIKALRSSGVSKSRLLAESRSTETEVSKATPRTTADDLLAERVAKAAGIQQGLRAAIRDVEAANPGISRSDAIDKVLFGRGAAEMVGLEKQIDQQVAKLSKLGGGSLPTPGPGRMHRTHNDGAPVRGQVGYDSSVDDRPPAPATGTGGPQSGADLNPIIRDHHQVLADIAAGKINETDPKFRALRALEMKRLYEKD